MLSSLGQYDLVAEIGRGGAGRVYRAAHRPTGAARAIKVLDGVPDPEALDRFRREAQALARLGGHGVVVVHESGVHESRLWFAMDLMPQGSLRAQLGQRERFPWQEAASLVASVANALARAHELGLVHRDVKPDNILFDEEGRPRLADFGCVRDLSAARLTQSGTILGTPAYMSPEQIMGRRVDARADVFALGVILHELVAGERPYPGTALVELHAQTTSARRKPLLGIGGAPRELDEIVAGALEPDCERRTQSARLLVEQLEALVAGKKAAARSAGLGSLVAAALAAILLLGGAVALVHGSRGPGPATTDATTDATPPPRPPVSRASPSPSLVLEEIARNETILADRVQRYLDELKPELAAKECRRSIAAVGTAAWAVVLLARSELESGRPVNAAALSASVIGAEPANDLVKESAHIRAHIVAAEVLGERLDPQGALEVLRTGLPWERTVEPSRAEAVKEGRDLDSFLKQLQDGNTKEMRRFVSDKSEHDVRPSQRAFVRAYAFLRDGDLANAASVADEVCRLAPARAGGWYLAAVTRLGATPDKPALEAATQRLERAVAIDPDHRLAWEALARVQNARGDRDRALAAAERALDLGSESVEDDARRLAAREPTVPAHALVLARVLFLRGKLDDAAEALRDLGENTKLPKSTRLDALLLRARVRVAQGDLPNGVADALVAHAVEQHSAAAAGVTAFAQATAGDTGGGLEMAKQALKIDPDEAFGHLARGLVLRLKHDPHWREDVQFFLEKKPREPEAATARALLDEAR